MLQRRSMTGVQAGGEGFCPPVAHIAKPAIYAPPANARNMCILGAILEVKRKIPDKEVAP
jgi:hypothetical protein